MDVPHSARSRLDQHRGDLRQDGISIGGLRLCQVLHALVDLLNNLDELAEDQNKALRNLPNKLSDFNGHELLRVTQQYGSGKTKQLLKSIFRVKLQHA